MSLQTPRWSLPIALVAAVLFLTPSAAAACLPDGVQSSGAKYRICMPAPGQWNGRLVLFAHGYVAFNQPIAIPEDQLTLPDGTSIPDLINGLGFAFATTSYSVNGLAVQQGIDDLVDLVDIFNVAVAVPSRTYLVGPSEGGIITALSVERFPSVYQAGVAACGPIGNFRAQINYIGDFRVVFDYFFPGLLPGTPADIPDELIENWETVYVPRILQAADQFPNRTRQLFAVTNAPGYLDPANRRETLESLLWYSTFTSNDATDKLGGLPYDNQSRIYTGSDNDVLLNLLARRFAASPAALAEMQARYETSGQLVRPVVTLHTLGDQIIPYWHEPLYRQKVEDAGAASLQVNIPVIRYGHCNFNAAEVLLSFGIMLLKDLGEQLPNRAVQLLPPAQRADFLMRATEAGILQP